MRTLLQSFFLALALLFSHQLHAQAPVIEWNKCIGTNDDDYATDLLVTSDGGYIMVGYSTGVENGDLSGHHGFGNAPDIWIVKTDKSGEIEWQKTFGGLDSDAGAYILPTSDGGYMLAASVASTNCNLTGNHGGFDFCVVKLSSTGDMIWQKMYGGSQQDYVTSFAPSSDGGYFLAGHTFSKDGDLTLNHGEMDYWVIKIDASGKLMWQKSLGGTGTEFPGGIKSTADGGCIMSGYTYSLNGDVSGNHGSSDYWIVKLDNKGTIQWKKSLGGWLQEFANAVEVCKDGSFIVCGITNSLDGNVTGSRTSYDAWIVKLDKTGNLLWERSYGGSLNETATSIKQTADGGYLFVGSSSSNDGNLSCNAGLADALVMKIDANGNLQWQKTMGGSGYDEAIDIEALADGSYVIAATSSSQELPGFHTPLSTSTGTGDYWLIKLSAPVATAPDPIVTIDPASATMCKGGTTTISASVLYEGITPTYQWFKNGSPAGTNSSKFKDANLNDNDQVSCIVTNNDQCNNKQLKGSDWVTVKLVNNNAIPSINISADNTVICNCVTITLTAKVTSAGGSPRYRWRINNNEMDFDYPTLVSNNLKEGDEIVCWYSDNLTCTGNGYVISNTIKITSAPATPSATIVASTDTVCKGGTVIFTASAINAGNSPVYQWKVNGVVTGSNSRVLTSSTITDGAIVNCLVTADPQFKCAAGKTATSNNIVMHVAGQSSPSVDVVASAESICTGSTATFTATAINSGSQPNYQWKINGVDAGINSNVFSSSALANNDIVTCTVDADRRNSCALANQVVSKSIRMTVTPGVNPSVTITADRTNVCAGENIRVTAVANNAGQNPGYQWILNGSGLPNNAAILSINSLANGDQLFCKITPGVGSCSSAPESSNVVISSILPGPEVIIFPSDTMVRMGTQVQLRPMIKGDVFSFQWVPADRLSNSQLLSPTTNAIFENSNYALTVTGSNGCKTTAYSVIKISTGLSMPNAFSPNGNGINDLFKIPPTAELDLREFSIFDRWGNRLFTTSNRNLGWDGMHRGIKQQAGTYVYMVRCKVKNKDTVVKGSFILVR